VYNDENDFEEDVIIVQFAYIPEMDLIGRVTEETPYYCLVEYESNGILFEELFNTDEVIFTKTISIPIEREWEE
jgi:hypothetical protein